MAPHGLGRLPHPETHLAAAAYPITDHPAYQLSTAHRRFWPEAGAWLNQGNTGTCVTNALGHRYADDPVPHAGITEAWARELYVAVTGDTSLMNGTSALAACRVMKSRGLISGYYWVPGIDEFKNTLLTVGGVCIGIPWYNSMDKPVRGADDRAYLVVDPSSGLRGWHEVEINAIELTPTAGPPYGRLKQSWGRVWPGDEIPEPIFGAGTVRVALTDIDELVWAKGGDAVVILEVP
jgi:hypothetical protein